MNKEKKINKTNKQTKYKAMTSVRNAVIKFCGWKLWWQYQSKWNSENYSRIYVT